MRPVTACDACRSNKRKCRLTEDGVCTRCRALNISCSLYGWAVRTPKSPTALAPLPIQSSNDGAFELQVELVSLYFLVVHDTHHSIFHRPSVEQQVKDGSIPKVLLYSMMALGARFSDNTIFDGIDRRRRGDRFTQRARNLLDLTDISVTTIQACILLGTVSFSESQTQSEALYYSAAIRLALILDLPNRPSDDTGEEHVNLRSMSFLAFVQADGVVWWSLYMIDIWSSMGLNLPRQLEHVEIKGLPLSHEVSSLTETTSLLWFEMVKLAQIWTRINQLNKESVNNTYDSSPGLVDSLAQELDDWNMALPSGLQESATNLDHYSSLGLGNAFAALHLGYHYYNEVLFYQFLARGPENQPNVLKYRTRCEDHALAFCNLLYACGSNPQSQCLYVMVGHMLVVTSTIYIHMLLFSTTTSKVHLARQRLEQNFEILTELQSYWVPLDVALSRLRVFHNACTRSIEESFRMDRWMLAFILEHGSAVGERRLGGDDTLMEWFLQTF